jgi:hypothetical protein
MKYKPYKPEHRYIPWYIKGRVSQHPSDTSYKRGIRNQGGMWDVFKEACAEQKHEKCQEGKQKKNRRKILKYREEIEKKPKF